MGARHVGLVLAHWRDLPDRQWRVLIRMAHTVLDDPKDGKPAATYWGGHELLAMTLGQSYPSGDSDEARKARGYALRNVRRAVGGLISARAVEIVDTGRLVRHGHSQTYLLTLESRLWATGQNRPPVDNRGGPHEPS